MILLCDKCGGALDVDDGAPPKSTLPCPSCGAPVDVKSPSRRPTRQLDFRGDEEFTPLPPLAGGTRPGIAEEPHRHTLARTPVVVRAVTRSITPVANEVVDLPAPRDPAAKKAPPAPASAQPKAPIVTPAPEPLPPLKSQIPVAPLKPTRPPAPPPDPEADEADLLAPKATAPSRRPTIRAKIGETVDLPAPKGAETPDLPAPKRMTAPAAKPRETLDLPTPAAQGGRATIDLPVPNTSPTLPDLPAPAGPRGTIDLPAPVGPKSVPDLPAPRAPNPGRATQPGPTRAPARETLDVVRPTEVPDLLAPREPDLLAPKQADLLAPKEPGLLTPKPADLLAPKEPGLLTPKEPGLLTPKPADLLTPKPPGEVAPVRSLRGQDLLTPKAVDVVPRPRGKSPAAPSLLDDRPIDVNALVSEDAELLRPKGSRPPGVLGPLVPPRDPDEPELVQPKHAGHPAAPREPAPIEVEVEEGSQPIEIEDTRAVEHRASSTPARPPSLQPLSLAEEPAAEPASAPPSAPAPALPSIPAAPRPLRSTGPLPMRKSMRPPDRARPRVGRTATVAVLLVLAAVGAVAWKMGLLDLGALSRGKGSPELEPARRLLGDDVAASYKKAAARAKELADADRSAREPRVVEAEAHYALAFRGVQSEAKLGDLRARELDALAGPNGDPGVQAVKAWKALVAGKASEADRGFGEALAGAPRDPILDVGRGWARLASGKPAEAAESFRAALALQPGNAAASHGLGQALEAKGDLQGALAAYREAFKASPQHLGAQIAIERLQPGDPVAAERTLTDQLKRVGAAGLPADVAAGWVLLGQRARAAGRRADAIDRFRQAVEADGQQVSARVQLARSLADGDQAHAAVEALTPAVARAPRDLEALIAMAQAQIGDGHPDQASAFLDRAGAVAPKDARIAYWRGRLAESRRQTDDAAKRYREAIAADPKLLDAYVSLAELLRARPAESQAALADAARATGKDPDLAMQLAEVELRLGNAQAAIPLLEKLTNTKEDRARARLDLAQAFERVGRLDDADRALSALEQRVKNAPGLAERRAALAVKRNRNEEALRLYDEALAEPSPRGELIAQAAALHLEMGQTDEALQLYERAAAADPRSPMVFLGLARAQLAAGRSLEAAHSANRSLALSDSPEAHLVAGQADETLNRFAEARSEYTSAAHGATEHAARLGLARLLAKGGSVQDALAQLAVVLKIDSKQSAPYLLQGDCYEELGDRPRARTAYGEASRLDPKSGEAAFKLGRAEKDAGERQKAGQLLDRAIALGGDKAPWAGEALLLAGDVHRQLGERAAAARAYRKWLELAPEKAPERHDVEQELQKLGGGQ